MKSKHIFSLFLLTFIFQSSILKSQIADTTDASANAVRQANIICDSAQAKLKRNDVKGANRLYNEAVKQFKIATKENPNSFAAWYGLGRTQTKTKDYKEAVLSFDKALEADATRSEAFRERGIAQAGLGKFDAAISDFDKAVDKNYNDAEAYYQRGLLKEKGKNIPSAMEDYAKAIEVNPNYKEAYFRRGVIHHDKDKDYVLALVDFNKYVELDPNNNEAYLWRGKTKYNGGDYKGADKDLSRFLDMESDNIEGLIARGATRIYTKDYAGSVTDLDNAIAALKKDPKRNDPTGKLTPLAYMNRGTAQGAQKNYKSALEDLDMAIKLKFDYSSAYINRALVKYVSGDKKGGCKDLEKADGLNNEKAPGLLEQYCKDMK